jgi:hypothetical protein
MAARQSADASFPFGAGGVRSVVRSRPDPRLPPAGSRHGLKHSSSSSRSTCSVCSVVGRCADVCPACGFLSPRAIGATSMSYKTLQEWATLNFQHFSLGRSVTGERRSGGAIHSLFMRFRASSTDVYGRYTLGRWHRRRRTLDLFRAAGSSLSANVMPHVESKQRWRGPRRPAGRGAFPRQLHSTPGGLHPSRTGGEPMVQRVMIRITDNLDGTDISLQGRARLCRSVHV